MDRFLQKINCYDKFGSTPDRYYRCFEEVEKDIKNNQSILKGGFTLFENDF